MITLAENIYIGKAVPSAGGGGSVTVDSELSLTSINPVQNKVITESIIVKTSTMPTASASLEGAVYQYVGNTTLTYTHGYIYECVSTQDVYSWERIDVQPSGGATITFRDWSE